MFTSPTRPALPRARNASAERRVSWPLYAYSAFEEFVLLYPFYALLFAEHGLTITQITSLFILWSLTAIVLEVPSGVLADIVPRRALLAIAPLLSGAGFTLWLLVPSYWSFAAGFLLWGAGGALASGALEALVYTELDARGAAHRYAAIMGIAQAVGVTAVGASTLIAIPAMTHGGYTAVGAASVAACVLCALSALGLPEKRIEPHQHEPIHYTATLRAGLSEVFRTKTVLAAAALAAALPAIWESLEEFVPLLAVDRGVVVEHVPWIVFIVWASVAAGSACAGLGARLSQRALGVVICAGALALVAGAIAGTVAGWLLIGLAFGLFQMSAVVAGARLQDRISGPSRATVTSVAGLGSEVLTVLTFLTYAWMFGLVGHAWAFALFAVPYAFIGAVVAAGYTRKQPNTANVAP